MSTRPTYVARLSLIVSIDGAAGTVVWGKKQRELGSTTVTTLSAADVQKT